MAFQAQDARREARFTQIDARFGQPETKIDATRHELLAATRGELAAALAEQTRQMTIRELRGGRSRLGGTTRAALTGPSAIGFGCDGTPHYVQGPYDDADRIVRTLRERVGVDDFHSTVEVPLQAV